MEKIKPKKGNIFLYVILLLLVISMMFTLKKCDRHELYPPLKIGTSLGDTIDIAIIYSPMSYYLYNDTIGGFNYDMLRLYAHDCNKQIRFWPIVSLNDALGKLDNGQFDILASLPIDQDFRNKFLYTNDIFLDRQVLIQRRDKYGKQSVNSSLDLANETIHIEKDSPIEFRIRNLSREIGDSIFMVSHPELSGEYLFFKIVSGEFKYAVINEKIALHLVDKYPDISIDTPISFTQFQAWLTRKNDPTLLLSLNNWIDSIKNTSTYREILLRYTERPSAE